MANHPYTIRVEAVELDNSSGDLKVTGSIKNLGTGTWGESYNIGLRNIRDRRGKLLERLQFAGNLQPFPVRPDQSAYFAFFIPTRQLPEQISAGEVALVKDGEQWFDGPDSGATPVEFPIPFTRRDVAGLLWATAQEASQSEALKLKVLAEAVLRYDFSKFGGVAELGKLIDGRLKGQPHRAPKPSSRFLSEIDKARGKSLFFQAFQNSSVQPAYIGSGPNVGQVATFTRYVEDAERFFRGACPPLPHHLTQYLNSRALPRELASAPITKAMMASVGRNEPVHFNNEDHFRNVSWRYITSVMIDRNLPPSIVPDSVVLDFAASPPLQSPDETFPNLTGFMKRVWSENEHYQNTYPVSSEHGRCGYAFDHLLLGMENDSRRFFLGSDIMDWMRMPVGELVALSPFEILVFANSTLLDVEKILAAGAAAPEVVVLRRTLSWLPAAPPAEKYPVRVIGLIGSQSGLGTNARMSIKALESLNMAVEAGSCPVAWCSF